MAEYAPDRQHSSSRLVRAFRTAAVACLVFVVLVLAAGCSNDVSAGTAARETTPTVGAHMAGPVIDVNVTPAVLAATPAPWDLTSPSSAARSYLEWTAYAYRTAQSSVATPTMSSAEQVRLDSYIQYNLEKSRLIDETLVSITFGIPSTTASGTVLPAKEKWTYSYLSVEPGNKVLGGPFTASYESTYTVVKTARGEWVVDSAVAKPTGTVK
jgi:hypothetical protein